MAKNDNRASLEPMRGLLQTQLDLIDDALPDAYTLMDWYDAGQPLDVFVGDDTNKECANYAAGYLAGVAEYADLTVGELLDEYDLRWKRSRKTTRVAEASR